MKYFLFVAICCISITHFAFADDVYLRSGYVYKNVVVLDTTNSWVRLLSKDDTTTIRFSQIVRMDIKKADLNVSKVFEIYSQEIYKAYTDSIIALSVIRNKQKEDSLATHLIEYKKIFPLYNELYVEAAGGVPNVLMFSMAYTIHDYLSAGIYMSPKDNFTSNLSVGLTFAMFLPSVTDIFKPLIHVSFAKQYASAALGALIPIGRGVFIMPDFGSTQYYQGFQNDKSHVDIRQNFFWSIGFGTVLPKL